MKTEITREDYLQFNKYFFYKNKLKRTFIIASISIILWVFILHIGEPFDLFEIVIELIAFYLCWTLFVLILTQIGLQKIKKMPDKDGNILGVKTYLLEENGFREITDTSETLTKWCGIKKIQESQDYYYVFVDKIAAYIIPKRSFLNKNEEDEFIKILKEKSEN
ncbi:YcxB family protein [Marinifilum fragile]|uniref:YcxB family protein n=1 Tax=Marinifilum fragile TaxID=570161 RepID=UPI002AA80FF9|nr:YcxB family protein [Marinifilum fragile]